MTPPGAGAVGKELAAVIVACGGLGLRFGGSPSAGAGYRDETGAGADSDAGVDVKQFLNITGRPVLAHTLAIFERHPRVDFVVLVLPEEQLGKGRALAGGLWPDQGGQVFSKVRCIVAGGRDRQGSVANGLAALAGERRQGPVLIHDGVRPCTPDQVIDRVIDGVLLNGNAIPAIRLRDTVKRAGADGVVLETIDRRELWQVQTPQGFRMEELAEAYTEGRRRGLQVTDDAALLEALGRRVCIVDGHPANIKLTWPEDVPLLEALLSNGASASSLQGDA